MKTPPLLRSVLLAALAATVLSAGCASHEVVTQSRANSGPVEYAVDHPATQPATSPADDSADSEPEGQSDEEVWKRITAALGRKGTDNNSVYTVRIPRDDLSISIEGMYIPTEAGIESVFYFHHCSCGKTTVLGAFCVTDFELNDVIDALRAGGIEVGSASQLLIRSQTNPLMLRFQGEGRADELARTLAAALKWTGKERNDPNPLFNKHGQ